MFWKALDSSRRNPRTASNGSKAELQILSYDFNVETYSLFLHCLLLHYQSVWNHILKILLDCWVKRQHSDIFYLWIQVDLCKNAIMHVYAIKYKHRRPMLFIHIKLFNVIAWVWQPFFKLKYNIKIWKNIVYTRVCIYIKMLLFSKGILVWE